MKQRFQKCAKAFTTLFGVSLIALFLLSACDGYTSVTHEEAYQAGNTLGRLIRGE